MSPSRSRTLLLVGIASVSTILLRLPCALSATSSETTVNETPTDASARDDSQVLQGDIQLGRIVFQEVGCADCHSTRFGENWTGFPNLAGVASRLSPEQLRTSILEPSREFAEGYHPLTVFTVDGLQIAGVELEEKSNATQLVVQEASGKIRSIDRRDIEEIRDGNSYMPLTDLNTQELANLVAFLGTLKEE